MKKVLLLLAIVMFGMTFAIGTPTSYDDYEYYYDDDWSSYGSTDSYCCCTGFVLPLTALFVGLGYTFYRKE